MEEKPSYTVEITPEAELHYLNLLEHLSSTHTPASALKKADEILDMAMSLDKNPRRGSKEPKLGFLGSEHRFLLYKVTSRRQVKIIYFVDEPNLTGYVTDFFGTEMDGDKIAQRSQ